MKEAACASHIRLDAAQIGDELWRNNTGVAFDESGRAVRFGLCNDSAKLSENIKSSDYIGITSVVITPEMVGQTIGVFTAIETKDSNWVFKETDKRAVAQLAFINIVLKAGGRAGFARTVQEYRNIVRK